MELAADLRTQLRDRLSTMDQIRNKKPCGPKCDQFLTGCVACPIEIEWQKENTVASMLMVRLAKLDPAH